MTSGKPPPSRWETTVYKNTLNLGFWTAAWVATMAVASFGPTLVWGASMPITLAAILFNVAVGIGMILANKRHLDGLDEMQRKIQLDAMALSLGVGLVIGLGYSNLDIANILPGDAEIAHLVVLMGLTYMFGIARGIRKYA